MCKQDIVEYNNIYLHYNVNKENLFVYLSTLVVKTTVPILMKPAPINSQVSRNG